MKVAMHQPHYFPWMGYLDKMAKADLFVIMDQVQLTDNSNMFRNRFLTSSGKSKYLSVSFVHTDYMEKMFCNVAVNKNVNWQQEHKNFILGTYRKHPCFCEVWSMIEPIFTKRYETACQVSMDSIELVRDLFEIKTPLVLQSSLNLKQDTKKSELVLLLCQAVNANVYLSGTGARKYMDSSLFQKAGIDVVYQSFAFPQYPQKHANEFVPNLSSLDILFNCGIEESRRIFWENVKSTNEFGKSAHD